MHNIFKAVREFLFKKNCLNPNVWNYILIHKVHMYKEYHSVCPLVGIGTLPTPLSPASVSLPPEPGGGGAQSPAGQGLEEVQFRLLAKKA